MYKNEPWTLDDERAEIKESPYIKATQNERSKQMKEVRKESIFTTIETLLGVLGHSKSEISNVMSIIVPRVSKVKQENRINNNLNKKGTSIEAIMAVLSNNPGEKYSVERISEESGVALKTVRVLIKQLRDSRKVKIVDYTTVNHGPAVLLYQTYRSPIKTLKTVTPEQGFDSVSSFVRNNKSMLGKSVTPTSFAYLVEKEGLTVYPMMLNIGIVKGYKTSELKKLAKNIFSISEEKPKRKYTKKSTKKVAKRKYTKKATMQPVELPVNNEVKGNQLNIFSFFKKNKKNSDLIKF